MNMDTYSKDRMNKINEHNKNRTNNDKKISYLLDTKLDNNVHYTLRKIEDLEARRLSYLAKNNKEDKQKKHIVEMVVALSYDKVKQYLEEGKTTKDLDKGFYQYAKNLENEYGFNTMEISIHKDEGHIDLDGQPKKNYHAHIEFLGLDSYGNSVRRKIDKKFLSDLQTEVAEILKMERGNNYIAERKKRPKRLDTYEYKKFAEEQEKINKIRKEVNEHPFVKKALVATGNLKGNYNPVEIASFFAKKYVEQQEAEKAEEKAEKKEARKTKKDETLIKSLKPK